MLFVLQAFTHWVLGMEKNEIKYRTFKKQGLVEQWGSSSDPGPTDGP